MLDLELSDVPSAVQLGILVLFLQIFEGNRLSEARIGLFPRFWVLPVVSFVNFVNQEQKVLIFRSSVQNSLATTYKLGCNAVHHESSGRNRQH